MHTVSLSADYDATENLDLYANASFSNAEADWKNLNLTTPGYVVDDVILNLYTFEGTNVIQSYSDLQFQQAEVNVGGTYQFTPALYVAAQAGWQLFKDKQSYVYGDQDGTAYRGSAGVGYKF